MSDDSNMSDGSKNTKGTDRSVLRQQQIDGNPELNAYIYQSVNEAQPLLPENAHIAVVVRQVTRVTTLAAPSKAKAKSRQRPEKGVEVRKTRFEVLMTTQLGDRTFEFKSRDRNMYTAVDKAKEALLFRLSEGLDERTRHARIAVYSSGNFSIH